ncbi:MAG: transglycosylase SLT domain-containing protein [Casimicrobiaceae bacterium]
MNAATTASEERGAHSAGLKHPNDTVVAPNAESTAAPHALPIEAPIEAPNEAPNAAPNAVSNGEPTAAANGKQNTSAGTVPAGTAPLASGPTATQASTAQNTAPIAGVVGEWSAELPPADLWDRIRAGFTMEDLEDEYVQRWERFYAERPDYVARIVERSSRYLFFIVTEIERRGMPLEIALLPMIESAFNPVALSTAQAAGIWQFIPSTGAQFGLKQDWWADSRRDVVAATHGALDYLSKLFEMFGDWQLALASYNWGEGAVMRAVARAKTMGKDGSYLTLNMPAETRNYLPKLQAIKNIIRDPEKYGINLRPIPNEPYFKTITLAHPIDVKQAARLAQISEEEFLALNPAHQRPVIGGRSEYQILLPASNADTFLANLETDAQPKVSWMAYRTRPGDRIDALAQRFGTTVAALRSVNGIRSTALVLPAGYNLLVPSDGPSEEALGSLQNAVFTKFPEYTPGRIHRVKRGETLAQLGKRYGVAPGTLAQWNRIGARSSLRVGQVLHIGGPAPVAKGKARERKPGFTKASARVGASWALSAHRLSGKGKTAAPKKRAHR